MKKVLAFSTLVLFLLSCANNKDTSSSDSDHAGNSEKPTAIDTTQHATGITNQNVISTDTAAMKVDSFQR